MGIINIYDTDARDLENLLMESVRVGDADELHNALIVSVKLIRTLQARVDALGESVELLRKIAAEQTEAPANSDVDNLLPEATRILDEYNKHGGAHPISHLQRAMRISFFRASKLLESYSAAQLAEEDHRV